MLALGVDSSLTATGYAWAPGRVGTFSADLRGLPRIRWQRESLGALVAHLRRHERLALAVLEGPAYDTRHQRGQHERAGLWWHLLDELDAMGVPVAVAPPSCVKLFALGKGSGKGTAKTDMVVAARERMGYRGTDDNEADALWCSALGYQRLGQPMVKLPASHLRGLEGVAWPRNLV